MLLTKQSIGKIAERIVMNELESRGYRATDLNKDGLSANSDILAAKDGKSLWLEVVRALKVGDAPEAIHGLLHWKARDLIQKGKKEGRILSMELIELLARSREEARDLGSELERFALSLR